MYEPGSDLWLALSTSFARHPIRKRVKVICQAVPTGEPTGMESGRVPRHDEFGKSALPLTAETNVPSEIDRVNCECAFPRRASSPIPSECKVLARAAPCASAPNSASTSLLHIQNEGIVGRPRAANQHEFAAFFVGEDEVVVFRGAAQIADAACAAHTCLA